MAAACPRDVAGVRDRALLLLAAAGFCRAALVGLDAEQLRFSEMAVELSLHAPASGGDGERRVTFPCGASLAACPVQALQDWAAIYSDSPWRISRRAPLIGEHNTEILCEELGLSRGDLSALAESWVI